MVLRCYSSQGTDEGQSLTFSTASSYTQDKVRVTKSGGEITLTELVQPLNHLIQTLVGGVHGHLVTVK